MLLEQNRQIRPEQNAIGRMIFAGFHLLSDGHCLEDYLDLVPRNGTAVAIGLADCPSK